MGAAARRLLATIVAIILAIPLIAAQAATVVESAVRRALDQAAAAGEIKREYYDDPGLELLRTLGLKHEQAYLSELEQQCLQLLLLS